MLHLPMAQFRASHWGAYLYIWAADGNHVMQDPLYGCWRLCAKRKEA